MTTTTPAVEIDLDKQRAEFEWAFLSLNGFHTKAELAAEWAKGSLSGEMFRAGALAQARASQAVAEPVECDSNHSDKGFPCICETCAAPVAKQSEAVFQRMRAAFHTNMLRAYPDKTHEEIAAEIDKAIGVPPVEAGAMMFATKRIDNGEYGSWLFRSRESAEAHRVGDGPIAPKYEIVGMVEAGAPTAETEPSKLDAGYLLLHSRIAGDLLMKAKQILGGQWNGALDDALNHIDYVRVAMEAGRESAAPQGAFWQISDAVAAAERIKAFPGFARLPHAVTSGVDDILFMLAKVSAAPADAPNVSRDAERLYRSWSHAQPNRCQLAPWYRLDDDSKAEWIVKAQARAPAEDAREEVRGDEAKSRAVIEHLGPAALTGGKMSVYDAFSLGFDAGAVHARASSVPAIPGTTRNDVLEEAALAAEKVQDDYRERQSGKWPELRDDAETGAGECVDAIRALKGAAPSHPSEAKAGEPGPWEVLEMKDQPEPGRLLDVVLTNGVIEEGREHSAIDWTQWRYSGAKAGEDA